MLSQSIGGYFKVGRPSTHCYFVHSKGTFMHDVMKLWGGGAHFCAFKVNMTILLILQYEILEKLMTNIFLSQIMEQKRLKVDAKDVV